MNALLFVPRLAITLVLLAVIGACAIAKVPCWWLDEVRS